MDGNFQTATSSTSITTATGTATSIPSNIKIDDTAEQHVDASTPGTTDLFEQQQHQQQKKPLQQQQPQLIQNSNPTSSSSSMLSSRDPYVNRCLNGSDNVTQSVTNNTSTSTKMNDSSPPIMNKNKDTRSISTEAEAGQGNDNNSVVGSVGSFSVDIDADALSFIGMNTTDEPAFGDTNAPSEMSPNADVTVDVDGNEFSQEESSETPIVDDRSGGSYPAVDPPNDLFENSQKKQIQEDQQHQAFLSQKEKQPSINPLPVVTDTSTRSEDNNNTTIEQSTQGTVAANTAGDSNINMNHSDDNQLMQCEGDLRSAEKIGYDQRQHGAPAAIQAPNNVTPRDVTNDQGIGQQRQNHQQDQQQGRNEEVIVLLDDDDVVEVVEEIQSKNAQPVDRVVKSAGFKRPRSPIHNAREREIGPGSSRYRNQSHNNYEQVPNTNNNNHNNHSKPGDKVSDPQYVILSSNHTPTWEFMFPTQNIPAQPIHNKNQHKHFELSLLNVSEFTITGLPVSMDGRLSSVLGFRKVIKQVSRGHGKAVFERDNPKRQANQKNDTSFAKTDQYSSHGELHNPDGGKWRIPLVGCWCVFACACARVCAINTAGNTVYDSIHRGTRGISHRILFLCIVSYIVSSG